MLGQPRTTQRRARKVASDEGALRGDIVRLASRFGRYGYRRVTDMLRIEGWGVNHKRVERIWRQEGLKVPQRQPKRGRLWLNDGSCIRLRPLYRGHVWSYDFVASRTHDGRALKLLTVLDEHTRECPAIVVALFPRMEHPEPDDPHPRVSGPAVLLEAVGVGLIPEAAEFSDGAWVGVRVHLPSTCDSFVSGIHLADVLDPLDPDLRHLQSEP